jgi:hypothetical protein
VGALELLTRDATSPVDDDTLEDGVWEGVCDWVEAQEASPRGVVADWFWSRLALWEVLDGGVAQLIANYPGDLGRMIEAWRALDQPEMAAVLQEARQRAGRFKLIEGDGPGNYAKTDGHFDDLDDRVDDHAEVIERVHVALLRTHRERFLAALQEVVG